jgi:extracellular factor (EF) 3-hydroxypalmitic acid methyl ester biosynthesis protein
MQKNGQTTGSEALGRVVVCETSQGVEFRAGVMRLTRHLVVFELSNPACVLQTSEVLGEFQIRLNDQPIYSGRAVVRNLVNAGSTLVCEAGLEDGWIDVVPALSTNGGSTLRQQYDGFFQDWGRFYRVLPEFKAVMADLQTFLTDLRLWLEQVELEIHASAPADQPGLERKAIGELADPVIRSIDVFVDKFESMVEGLETDLHPIHRAFLRRQLHPLVMCAPFAHRAFHKPLGYAGDYEMVGMMMRPPDEGSTLFARIINTWLLRQAPALAHRNRVDYLTRKLVEEAVRARSQSRPLRVFNLGCGPAAEVQTFLREHAAIAETRFTLLDFNEETLEHVRARLEAIKQRHGRNLPVQFIQRSVHQILKDSGRSVQPLEEAQYDYVYCAGLFDYLSDQVCKRLMNYFYGLLAPNGLLVVTNVSDVLNQTRPFRYSMEYILDWHLIYRDGPRVLALAPDSAPPESSSVFTEDTGVNVFLEVRKPGHV